MKKALLFGVGLGLSVLSWAQETTTLDLTDYMGQLQDSAETQVENLLPLLGEIATIGIVLFLALWAFRAVKRFLGR